ncbi:DNA binding protein [Elsinoe australis]|uniref:DNA binding protein n=1 Tax=Elsinoe australis TaxID=40998 RepID=A0A4U7BFW3_9PEZI|nr:DNA binding protein [Elsinoe australis]
MLPGQVYSSAGCSYSQHTANPPVGSHYAHDGHYASQDHEHHLGYAGNSYQVSDYATPAATYATLDAQSASMFASQPHLHDPPPATICPTISSNITPPIVLPPINGFIGSSQSTFAHPSSLTSEHPRSFSSTTILDHPASAYSLFSGHEPTSGAYQTRSGLSTSHHTSPFSQGDLTPRPITQSPVHSQSYLDSSTPPTVLGSEIQYLHLDAVVRQPTHTPDQNTGQYVVHHNGQRHTQTVMPTAAVTQPQRPERPWLPWPILEEFHYGALRNQLGEKLHFDIHCRMEKGFSLKFGLWTGYRRNYCAPSAAFTIHPPSHNQLIYFHTRNVKGFAMKITAVLDEGTGLGHNGPTVDMIQFTAKRDHGEKGFVKMTKIAPGLPLQNDDTSQSLSLQYSRRSGLYNGGYASGYMPVLPYQMDDENDTSARKGQENQHRYTPDHPPLVEYGTNDGIRRQHCFDRLQFQKATNNNGKRRALQQYYFIKVELYADIREDGAARPEWDLVAHRISERLVIRGRSPNHYKEEDAKEDGNQKPGDEGASKKANPGNPPPSAKRSYDRAFDTANGPSNDGGYSSNNQSSWRHQRVKLESDVPPLESSNGITPLADDESPLTVLNEEGYTTEFMAGFGEDLQAEIHQGLAVQSPPFDFSEQDGFINYRYDPTPIYQATAGPVKKEEDFDDAYTHTACHDEYPRSMPGPSFNESFDMHEFERNYETSAGQYPRDLSDNDTPT